MKGIFLEIPLEIKSFSVPNVFHSVASARR